MEKDSTIWQYLGWASQKLQPAKECSDNSTQDSNEFQNPLRKVRRSHSPFEIEDKITFKNPIRVDKKRRHDFNQKVCVVSEIIVNGDKKPHDEDLY
jgi:hypothetical protein